jgi:hypothetical protein
MTLHLVNLINNSCVLVAGSAVTGKDFYELHDLIEDQSGAPRRSALQDDYRSEDLVKALKHLGWGVTLVEFPTRLTIDDWMAQNQQGDLVLVQTEGTCPTCERLEWHIFAAEAGNMVDALTGGIPSPFRSFGARLAWHRVMGVYRLAPPQP